MHQRRPAYPVIASSQGVFPGPHSRNPLSHAGDGSGVVLGVPVGVAVGSITATTASADWAAVTSATGYLWELAEDAAFTSLVASNTTKPAGFENLSPATTYYFRVRASAGIVRSGWAATTSFATTA